MARRTSRHRRASVDCYTVDNVTDNTAARGTPALPIDLPQDLEFTRRCMCSCIWPWSMYGFSLPVETGSIRNPSALINDEQYLPFQINLEVRSYYSVESDGSHLAKLSPHPG